MEHGTHLGGARAIGGGRWGGGQSRGTRCLQGVSFSLYYKVDRGLHKFLTKIKKIENLVKPANQGSRLIKNPLDGISNYCQGN